MIRPLIIIYELFFRFKMQNGPPSDIHVGASEFRPSSAIGNDKSGAGRARALSQAATAAVFVPGGGHGQGTQVRRHALRTTSLNVPSLICPYALSSAEPLFVAIPKPSH